MISDLYRDYISEGELPRTYFQSGKKYTIKYPVLVTDTADDVCRLCRKHPEINFCRGPNHRKLDRDAAEILGIRIGEEYSEKEPIRIFEDKARKQELEIGKDYDWHTFVRLAWEGKYPK